MKLPILIAAGALTAGLFVTLKKSGASLSGARRRRGGLRGETEARDLLLFCENDGDLYRQQVQPIQKNLEKKMAKGVYNHEKAKKLWGHLADNCAKKYVKEFGGGSWHKLFSTADRRHVAAAFADDFRDNHGG